MLNNPTPMDEETLKSTSNCSEAMKKVHALADEMVEKGWLLAGNIAKQLPHLRKLADSNEDPSYTMEFPRLADVSGPQGVQYRAVVIADSTLKFGKWGTRKGGRKPDQSEMDAIAQQHVGYFNGEKDHHNERLQPGSYSHVEWIVESGARANKLLELLKGHVAKCAGGDPAHLGEHVYLCWNFNDFCAKHMPAKDEITKDSGDVISWKKPSEFKHKKATGDVQNLPPSYLRDIGELLEYCSKITNLTCC